jgi:hypothetical protein
MRILYLIFVLCVGALVWVAFAAARHIRRHEVKARAASEEKHRTDEVAAEKEILVPADET